MLTCRKVPFPYEVAELKHFSFYDLEQLTKEIVTNRNKNTSKETVNWLKIKWLRFEKGASSVGYKYDVDEPFKYIVTSKCPDWTKVSLKQKYERSLPISMAKKKDLMALLRTGVIPNTCKNFYQDLEGSTAVTDEPAWDADHDPDAPKA